MSKSRHVSHPKETEEKQVVDCFCTCSICEGKTKETYLMNTSCNNCTEKFVTRHREGDRTGGAVCPYCGNSMDKE